MKKLSPRDIVTCFCLELEPKIAESLPSALSAALTLKTSSQLERADILFEQGGENVSLALMKWAVQKMHHRRNQEGGREQGLDWRED